MECPRRKTADRNIPLRALLWASALTRRGHYPSLTRETLIHLCEACIGPVLSVCVCFWLKLGSSLGSSCLRAASRTEQDRAGRDRTGQDMTDRAGQAYMRTSHPVSSRRWDVTRPVVEILREQPIRTHHHRRDVTRFLTPCLKYRRHLLRQAPGVWRNTSKVAQLHWRSLPGLPPGQSAGM